MQASPSQASPQPPAANTSVTPGAPPAAGIASVKAGAPPVAESAFQPTPGEVTILLLVVFSSFFVFVFVVVAQASGNQFSAQRLSCTAGCPSCRKASLDFQWGVSQTQPDLCSSLWRVSITLIMLVFSGEFLLYSASFSYDTGYCSVCRPAACV